MKLIYLKDKEIDEKLVYAVARHFEQVRHKCVEVHGCKDSRELAELDLKNNSPKVIVTFNLAGFDIATLTDGLSYNLVDSKFVHFLLKENLPNEKYLVKQLSISMFFYCVGTKYCQYLLNEYPEMPWLEVLDGWKKDEEQASQNNITSIVSAIEEIIRECRL